MNETLEFPKPVDPTASAFDPVRDAARALAVATNQFNTSSREFPGVPAETREIYVFQLNLKLREYNHWLNDFQSLLFAMQQNKPVNG